MHLDANVRFDGDLVPCEERSLLYFSVRKGVWFDFGTLCDESHPLVANGYCGAGRHGWCVSVRNLRVWMVSDSRVRAWARPLVRDFCERHMFLSDWLINLI